MSLEYRYKPLTESDSIRLIELQPAIDSPPAIYCNLIHTSLSKCDNRDIFGPYTALSYVWGSPDKVKTIWIDGAPAKITANLFSAIYN